MTTDKALRLALEALEGVLNDSPKVREASITGGLYEVVQCREAITALRQALEQPKVALTREEFMGFYRSEAYDLDLSPDDKMEIFVGALQGSADINKDTIVSLLSEYDVSLETFLKEMTGENT